MKMYRKGTILRSTVSNLELTLTEDQFPSTHLTGSISKAEGDTYHSVGNYSTTWNGNVFCMLIYEAKKNVKIKSLLTPTLR